MARISKLQPFANRSCARWCGRAFLLLALVLVQLGLGAGVQVAQAALAARVKITDAYGPAYYWILKTWKDHALACEVYVNHEGAPTQEEVQASCDYKVYQDWIKTPVCNDYVEKGETNNCAGAYLVYLGKVNRAYQKVTVLPQAEASFALANCPNREWCDAWPSLRIYGIEPLMGYTITEVHLKTSQRAMVCKGVAGCDFTLPRTTADGIWIEYWAVSSYGDESQHRLLHLRNLYRVENGGQYYLEILSYQVNGDSAAVNWGAFPDLKRADAAFYGDVGSPAELATQNHLFYLSGMLINAGKVDTQECAGGVLLSNGMAGACGEEQAYQTSVAWQNQFDQAIYQAAIKYGLPPRILKGILAQESQFWPDTANKDEYGIGCLTENGIDALLIADMDYYLSACQSLYKAETCASGYGQLTLPQRAALRGMALRAVGTDQEIDLVARVLRAQSVQVGQIVQDQTSNLPGQVAHYEDLWDLSIAGYHAGSGCIKDGVQNLVETDQPVSFKNYCAFASGSVCSSGCAFVEKVKDYVAQPE